MQETFTMLRGGFVRHARWNIPAAAEVACWSYNPATGSFVLANRDLTFVCVL